MTQVLYEKAAVAHEIQMPFCAFTVVLAVSQHGRFHFNVAMIDLVIAFLSDRLNLFH